ncbi:hypothetical protein HMPREF1503_1619 [Olsenella uli MSTE5]|nr:hypothetical protein HMPREF1503_1619 [Olsenella uli MSTE5]
MVSLFHWYCSDSVPKNGCDHRNDVGTGQGQTTSESATICGFWG